MTVPRDGDNDATMVPGTDSEIGINNVPSFC